MPTRVFISEEAEVQWRYYDDVGVVVCADLEGDNVLIAEMTIHDLEAACTDPTDDIYEEL